MTDEEKKLPKITVGALIINTNGKMLLVRCPKWQNKLVIPGGHVEWAESINEALQREIFEEVGIKIFEPKILKIQEFIFSKDYLEDRHIIALDYEVKTDVAEEDVKIDGKEIVGYVWLTPAESEKRDDIEKTTREYIREYQRKVEEKSALEEYKAGWQRAVADYKNLQKETSERRQLLLEMSEQQILEEFIPVYGHLKLAINNEQLTNNKDPWLQGVRHVAKQFESILKAHKVEEIKTVGEKFDTKFHEAAGEEPGDGEPGTITREVDGGYVMGGRVIKPAKVIIISEK